MIVAEQIADFLASRGCTHAFGIVGGANLVLFEALSRRMKVVSVMHEQAAACAANYYYRVCGRIAPVLPTNGGGSINALTGVAEAFMDSIPMLVISGNEQTRFIKAERTRTIGFQGIDSARMAEQFTKKSISVDNPLACRHSLQSLYDHCLEPRQGPCWLDVPQDVAMAVAE